ncbi:MAG: HAMP domain-containing protein, partial [Candidatus Dadabacteria bacterium]
MCAVRLSRKEIFLLIKRAKEYKLFFGVSLLSLFLIFMVYLELPPTESLISGGNLFFFILVNTSIVITGLLLIMIGRNVAKLVFDRKRKVFGSRLRTRLVAAFVGLIMIPTIITFLMASGILSSVMEGWFSRQVEGVVEGAVEVARSHYNVLEETIRNSVERIRKEIESSSWRYVGKSAQKRLEKKREENGLFSLKIIDKKGNIYLGAASVVSGIEEFAEPELRKDALENALKGKVSVFFEEKGPRQFIRVYSPLNIRKGRHVLAASYRVPPELSAGLGEIISTYDEYKKLTFYKQPLKSSYMLTLAMITALLLFSAIWVGFFIAKQVAIPLQRLAEGTREVSQGNYDVYIKPVGRDEIASLIRSFNKMTGDLKRSRAISEQRRVYLETLLANISLGVIAVDMNNRITLANEASAEFFEIGDLEGLAGKDIGEVFAPEYLCQIEPIMSRLSSHSPDKASGEIVVISRGRKLQIACSAGRITDREGKPVGTVLIFDDVTELSKAHQMAAWREVARRIAHEIKNPLTPIKLSAQRLQKIIGSPLDPNVAESLQAILENVDSIKRLSEEFSHFARMPRSHFEPEDLNELVAETLAPYSEQNANIVIQFISDAKMPEIQVDK